MDIKKYCALLVLPVLLTSSGVVFSADETGFDEICRIYTEAKNSSMSIEELSEYIFDNVKKRVSSTDALQAHDAVFQADPAVRYKLFKESAEYSLKREWDCAVIREVMK